MNDDEITSRGSNVHDGRLPHGPDPDNSTYTRRAAEGGRAEGVVVRT